MIQNPIPYTDYVYLDKFCGIETDGVLFGQFQYDYITDDQINLALSNIELLSKVNPKLDWEVDYFLYSTDECTEEMKHAYRVASVINSILSEGIENPVEFDTFSMFKCHSCITNGHHRVRALQFLKINILPLSMSGSCDIIDYVLQQCGVEGYTPSLTI